MKFIIGKKIEMTQVWQNSTVVPVTKVQAGPCVVTQIKHSEKDGYIGVQLGFGEKKEKNIKKPQIGHLKKISRPQNKIGPGYLREFRSTEKESESMKEGDVIRADIFAVGDKIDVIGISKGKGFAGVIKRHGFSGASKSHGTKDQLRMPGSIGPKGPAHVFKGMKMGGRLGGDRVTAKNLEIIEVEGKNNVLLIKGSIPGARNGLVLIKSA